MRRVALDPYRDHDPTFVMIEPIPPEPADDWPAPFVARNDDLLPGYPPEEPEPRRIERRQRARAHDRAHLRRFFLSLGVLALWIAAIAVAGRLWGLAGGMIVFLTSFFGAMLVGFLALIWALTGMER